MTLSEWLLLALVLIGAGILGSVGYGLHWLRVSGVALRTLGRLAGSSARVTSAKPFAQRDRVHLVLMDRSEKTVDYVMVIDPSQRAQSVTYGSVPYTCVSGSVAEGHFVYRRS